MTNKANPLARLIGAWTTEAEHSMLPGLVVRGTTVFEWLEGERFVIQRSRIEHPDFPDFLGVIGDTDQDRAEKDRKVGEGEGEGASHQQLHYYDSRGVFRIFESRIDDRTWKLWRDAPGFSQRFTGTFSDDGDTIAGVWELRRDDVTWAHDLESTYRRVK